MSLRKACFLLPVSLSCPPQVAPRPKGRKWDGIEIAWEAESKGFLCRASQGAWGISRLRWFLSPAQVGATEWRCLQGSLADFPPTCVLNGASEHLPTPARDVEEAVTKPRVCLGNAGTDAVTRREEKEATPRTRGHSRFPRSPCRTAPS